LRWEQVYGTAPRSAVGKDRSPPTEALCYRRLNAAEKA
jgi:hypothetical protein